MKAENTRRQNADTQHKTYPKCEKHVSLLAQGQLLKLKTHFLTKILGGGIRTDITSFSAASRKRMLETLARVDIDLAGFKAFITLTYPDQDNAPSPTQTSRDCSVFLKRIKRRFPQASAIWRREWCARESGNDQGALYPHFHLLFFNLPFIHYEEVNRIWQEVIGYDGYLRTEIKAVETWRKAFGYVAKYMAKVDKERQASQADESAALKARSGGGEAAACSLVYSTYLTGNMEKENKGKEENNPKTGRHWGIFNRKRFPYADSKAIRLPYGKWLDQARELAATEWAGISDNYEEGFTLFVDDSNEWFESIKRLCNGAQAAFVSGEDSPQVEGTGNG
jgi:hypothetical protein